VYDIFWKIIQGLIKMPVIRHSSSKIGTGFKLFFLFLLSWNLGEMPLATSTNEAIGDANIYSSTVALQKISIQQNIQKNASIETPTPSLAQKNGQVPGQAILPSPDNTQEFQGTAALGPGLSPTPVPDLTGSYSPDEVLIKFDPNTPKKVIEQCLGSVNATLDSQIEELHVLEVKIPNGKVTESISSLSACQGILYAEPNYDVWMADIAPNDPGWGNQYGLLAIHAPQGWALSTGSPSVTIAFVDTGVDTHHVDLAGKIVPGYDFVNEDNDPQDDNGHGTHVAGTAAAISNNRVGITGVSWGARIMPIKALNAYGNGSFAEVAAGIAWAADHGAQVINLSLGGTSPSSVLEDAVNYAYGKGVILVAAGGNMGSNSVLFPAAYPHVIAVAATDESNKKANFSNFGPEIDVAASGVSIYSTVIGNAFGYMSGTSMSTAYVSGLAAILRGIPNNSNPDKIAQEIETTSLDLGVRGWDEQYGYGLIQLDAAIQFSLTSTTPVLTPTFNPPTTVPNSDPALLTAQVLPATGFLPGRKASLEIQPAEKAYEDLGKIWLEIPHLELALPIVGVPQVGNGWDVSWLGRQAGWLNGTAFPTAAGNSVISAHVYDAYGKPGPFVNLSTLSWGDQIIVHAFGYEYVYEVRESKRVTPDAVSSAIQHEKLPWLTLITCQGYDGASNDYKYRTIISAVEVEIR
jgi:LPXTG-site transpeptidase (sortase) family protein